MEDENRSNTIEEEDFLSSVIAIEMEHWGSDIAGTKAVLMALGCTAQRAEAALEAVRLPLRSVLCLLHRDLVYM
jgi:hypothetical protein